jgi:hypothetical protein
LSYGQYAIAPNAWRPRIAFHMAMRKFAMSFFFTAALIAGSLGAAKAGTVDSPASVRLESDKSSSSAVVNGKRSFTANQAVRLRMAGLALSGATIEPAPIDSPIMTIPGNRVNRSQPPIDLPDLGSRGVGREVSRAGLIMSHARREGLPVLKLWENHSTLVHIGLNDRGKPGLWVVGKTH